ncbi:hypothetical protein F2P81_001991 [Scophthalmus maximus]|uniref:Uncharacterized protein n=1 Tax=Scophthalmus maximus TaxID=52904 RepID=A0A6A4TTX5_SCOMX|nr:hypothetical protein F2P81_001991 [Scophthalmus maximus]
MIGECRWALLCFPYRHWISSPPLRAAAPASPDTSCSERRFHSLRLSRLEGDKMSPPLAPANCNSCVNQHRIRRRAVVRYRTLTGVVALRL